VTWSETINADNLSFARPLLTGAALKDRPSADTTRGGNWAAPGSRQVRRPAGVYISNSTNRLRLPSLIRLSAINREFSNARVHPQFPFGQDVQRPG
jgi:hypothetical protein